MMKQNFSKRLFWYLTIILLLQLLPFSLFPAIADGGYQDDGSNDIDNNSYFTVTYVVNGVSTEVIVTGGSHTVKEPPTGCKWYKNIDQWNEELILNGTVISEDTVLTASEVWQITFIDGDNSVTDYARKGRQYKLPDPGDGYAWVTSDTCKISSQSGICIAQRWGSVTITNNTNLYKVPRYGTPVKIHYRIQFNNDAVIIYTF